MTFGLTPTGYVKKRLQDIKTELEQAFTASYGEINTEPDSVFGQLIGVLSKVLADQYEGQEAVYYSQYPNTAEGISLDYVALLLGVTRLEATPTRVVAAALGAEGTQIPIESICTIPETNQSFRSTKTKVITRSDVLKIIFKVTEAVNNEPYSILLNNKVVSINSGSGATKGEVAAKLKEALILAFPNIEFTSEEEEITCYAKDGYTSFSLMVNTHLEVTKMWTPVPFECTITGPVICPIGSLNRVDTLVSGWDEVTNFSAGTIGTNIESDKELRKRRASSLRIGGAATVESIKARMYQEVPGVRAVTIFENRSRFPDAEGRPAHSFETIISGGNDLDIAKQIWKTKPAGIETFGNVGVIIKDSQGDEHMMHFSRPVEIYCWVRCALYLYDEELFPSDGLEMVKEIIFLVGEELGVGKDVIVQRFHGPIYKFVSGIGKIEVQIATSLSPEDPAGEYTFDNLDVNARQVPVFSKDRIDVILGV